MSSLPIINPNTIISSGNTNNVSIFDKFSNIWNYYRMNFILGVIFTNIIITCVLNVVSIVELVYLDQYGDDIHCNSSLINPYKWLLINSIVNIVCAFLFVGPLIINYFNQNIFEKYSAFACVMCIFCAIFSVIWMIIGSIMFWRDCNNKLPQPINDLFYGILITYYIIIGLSLLSSDKK